MGPSQKRRKVLTSSDALPNHIPLYFPPYPDKYSFVNTPLFVEREKDRKKLRSRKNKERTQLEDNLTKFHNSVDTTNLTNYDHPQGIISSDFTKVQPSPPSESFTQPTPIDAESPFLNLLYQARNDLTPAPTEQPEITGSQKEKEKQHHVDSILSLNHDKNMIDQLVLEPLPATTTTTTTTTNTTTTNTNTPASAPTPSSNTPNTTTDKYDDMLGRIEL